MGPDLAGAGRRIRGLVVAAGLLLVAVALGAASLHRAPAAKTVTLRFSYTLTGSYSQTLVDGASSCSVKFAEQAKIDDSWSSASAKTLQLASGATSAFLAHELPDPNADWSIDGKGYPGSDCSGAAATVHCSGHVRPTGGPGTTRPSFLVFVRGGTVAIAAASGSVGLNEDGNDCLTGAQWDAGAPTIYPALPDVTGPYMGVGARTTVTALARLRKGGSLTLTAVPSAKPSGYSPATCNHAADGGATISSCKATFKVLATIRVTRVR